LAMGGADGEHIRESLRSSEPVRIKLRINEAYPSNIPLQSTPPTLLMNLPKLPPESDYRLMGRDLVLRDAKTNLIVDIVPNAIT
jgi:hypothetical protein